MRLRPATSSDAPALAEIVHAGLLGYQAFAPPGWAPWARDDAAMAVELARPEVRCTVAEDDAIAGLVSWLPAARSRRGGPPELAHLMRLFVAEPWWGAGVAPRLLAGAVAEAGAAGFASMRLVCAAGQARARRFYEREGWSLGPDAFDDADLGLTLVEYRRTL